MINVIIMEARSEGFAMRGQLINKQTITRIRTHTHTHTHTHTRTHTRTHGAQLRSKQKQSRNKLG